MSVTLAGSILDGNRTRALLAKAVLSQSEVMALDKVRKKRRLNDAEFKVLKAMGLIEGRQPNTYVAASVAAAAGQEADCVLTSGFDDAGYQDLILKRQPGTWTRCGWRFTRRRRGTEF